MNKNAAGLFLLCSNQLFLVKRNEKLENPGTWGIPGGYVEEGESSWHAALREITEECGSIPPGINIINSPQKVIWRGPAYKYTTYIITLPRLALDWKPKINWESDQCQWFHYLKLPIPLHWGVKWVLNHLKKGEQV